MTEAKIMAERAEKERVARELREAEEQAYREKLERENQEELQHVQTIQAVQVVARATVKPTTNDTNEVSATQASKEFRRQAVETVRDYNANTECQAPPREQLIKTVASKFFVTFEVAEQWLVEAFAIEVNNG